MTIQSTLILSVVFALIAASIYAYAGWRLNKRVISASESRLAWQFFTVWWYGLAASTLIGGLLNLMGALGLTNLALYVTATYMNLLISCVALLGLFYYLIYLFTGNGQWLKPLVVFYALAYIVLVYYVTSSEPVDVTLEPWSASLAYRIPMTGPFIVILVALLFASQIFGGFVYFTLYFRVPDVTQKYRILLVSWSIILWFLIPFVGIAAGLQRQDWWEIFSRLLGLAAARTTLLAYWPPQWLKRRYRILSLADEKREG
ncbi:MAG TPA: hypothetical protein VIR02_10925 [Anaerolineales bacterium]